MSDSLRASVPRPNFDHLASLTDRRGTFEHALFDVARPEHGYCTDDAARVLMVACRAPEQTADIRRLAETSLRFLDAAQHVDGRYRNRMSRSGRFTDRPRLDDCWGRALWGLGTAIARSPSDWVRVAAAAQFDRAARQCSTSLRARSLAILGAAEVLAADPTERVAHELLVACAERFPLPSPDDAWPWPEASLTYANPVIAEAMIAAGTFLDSQPLVDRGLKLLGWLLDLQMLDGHLSVVPVGGAGPDDRGPRFDQQPIEVAALADACARAAAVDRSRNWANGVGACVDWFLGVNDAGSSMWDPATGGGYDGLTAEGPNLNEGAESSIALLSTLQHAPHLVVVG